MTGTNHATDVFDSIPPESSCKRSTYHTSPGMKISARSRCGTRLSNVPLPPYCTSTCMPVFSSNALAKASTARRIPAPAYSQTVLSGEDESRSPHPARRTTASKHVRIIGFIWATSFRLDILFGRGQARAKNHAPAKSHPPGGKRYTPQTPWPAPSDPSSSTSPR